MELLLADLEKENQRYLRKDIDGGILDNKIDIDRYKYQQYCEVIDNLMLGNYNEFGEYEIQDDIKSELLKCEKVISDNFENLLFVKSKNPINAFGNLNFVVKVIDNEQAGYRSAYLELLEPIYKAKGFIENTQATVIKKVTLPKNDLFKESVYKEFNIVLNNSSDGAKIESEDKDEFKETIDRKIKLLYIKRNMEMNNEYEMCFKKCVKELEKTEEGKEVLEKYQKKSDIAEKLGVDKKDYRAQTEILASCAEEKKEVAHVISAPLAGVFSQGKNKAEIVMGKMKKAVFLNRKSERRKQELNKPEIKILVKQKDENSVQRVDVEELER